MIKAENPLNTNLLDTDINITAPTKNINSENNSIPNDKKQNSLLNLKDQPFWQSTINWWHKIALFLLIAQGLQGTWQSVRFIAIDYKEFEKKLTLHHISTNEINFLIATALITLGAALINIFMAIKLNKVKEKTAHNIDLFIATIIILGTNSAQKFLIQLDIFNLIKNLF